MVALAGGPSRFSASALAVLAAAAAQGLCHAASKPLLSRYAGREVACYATWAGTAFAAPPAALVFSCAWLSEVPSPVAIAGGLVSVGGVLVNSRRPAGQAPAAPGQQTTPGKAAASGRAVGEKVIRNAG